MAHWLKKFVAQIDRLISNNKFMALCTAFVLFNACAYFFPASYWYEIKKINIQDSKTGQSISMVINREINRDFIGTRSVIVRRMSEGTGDIVCADSSLKNYQVGEKLPANLTLGWWSNGTCVTLDEGAYMVTTIVNISVPSVLQPKTVVYESNVFRIEK